LQTKSFSPNFLWPIPEIDDDDILHDGIWLCPGVLPEPYIDYTLGNDVSRVKSLVNKAHLSPLSTANKDLIKWTFE